MTTLIKNDPGVITDEKTPAHDPSRGNRPEDKPSHIDPAREEKLPGAESKMPHTEERLPGRDEKLLV